jgi:hypothetical protein
MVLSVRNSLELLVLVCAISVTAWSDVCDGAGPYLGLWSKNNVLACAKQRPGGLVSDGRKLRIPAPDGKRAIRINGLRWFLDQGGTSVQIDATGIGWPAEVSWAPSSRYFFVTEGLGLTTGFRTRVYAVSEKGIERLPDFNDPLKSDFDARYPCKENYPNVVGIAWLAHDQLLVGVQSPNRGNCDVEGVVVGYVVSLPEARVRRRLTTVELKKQYGQFFGHSLNESYAIQKEIRQELNRGYKQR